MSRKLLATTAIAALLTTGAWAQEATQPAPMEPTAPQAVAPAEQAAPVVKAEGHLGTQIIGESVYNGTGDQAENIGNVNDIVIDNQGKVQSVVVGVGGFLGIGEKNVAVNFDDVNWAEQNGDRWLVVATTKEALESQPAFDPAAYAPAAPVAAAPAAPATDQTAEAPAAPTQERLAQNPPADPSAATPAQPTDDMATAAIDKSTLSPFDTTSVSAEELVGTTVYGANDANLGEIGDIVLTQDGKVDAVIIDVGGFLGVGEKPVAVGMDNLAFMTDANGNKFLYTTFTKEQLDAAAAYDKSTWAEKRNEQRVILR